MKPALIPGLVTPKSEGDLQSQVLAYLALVPGLTAARTNSGLVQTKAGRWVHLCPKGWPDITGHMPDGRALYIELKDPKAGRGNARRRETIALQEAFIAAASARGCVAFTARSLEEVADRIGKEIARRA